MSDLFKSYLAYRFFCLVAGAVLFFGVCVVFIGSYTWEELSRQSSYRRQWGAEWQTHYEQRYGQGAVSEGKAKAVVGIVAMPTILGMLVLIYRQATGEGALVHHSSSRRRRRRHRR